MRRLCRFALVCCLALLPGSALAYVYYPDSSSTPPSQTIELPVPPDNVPLDLIYDDAVVTTGWDWRVPTYDIHLAGSPTVSTVPSPFWQPLEGLQTLDYEPTDGWELMARDFGTATVGVDVPFLVLYNKYRGTVRFIAYLTAALRENYSSGRIIMRYSGSVTTKNLNQRSVLNPLDHFVPEAPISIINLQIGWNYADFTVEYDPNVHTVIEPMFVFDIDGISTNTITLGGTSVTATRGATGVTNTGANPLLQLQTLVTNLNKAQKEIATDAEAIFAFMTWADQLKDDKHKKAWENAIKVLKSGRDPLSMLFGLVDLGVTFFGGKKSTAQPQIATTISNLALSGAMTAQERIYSIPLRVPGANHNGRPNALPIWNYPLGILAITQTPSATYSTSASAYNSTFQNTPCNNCVYLSGFAKMDILQLNGPVSYQINTSFPGALQPRSVEAAWSWSAPHRLSTPPPSPPTWWSPVTPPVYVNWMNNLVNTQGRLAMIGSADLFRMGFHEYRTQFVPLNQFHLYRPEISRAWTRAEPAFTQRLGMTPPVQVRVRLQRPGGTPANDLFLVRSYDLFWPTSFPTTPEPWNLPAVAPIWAEPVAPLQAVTAPAPGAQIPRGQDWSVLWNVQIGSIDSVEVYLSSDNGVTYPTQLGRQLENSGSLTFPGLTTVGSQYRVKVRTRNGPVSTDAAMSGPFTVWGITGTAATIAPVCASQTPTSRLSVTWNTNVATAGSDKIVVTAPNGVVHSTTKSLAASATAHSISIDVPCATGAFTYRVSSTLNGVECSDDPRSIQQAAACPTDCVPPAAVSNLYFVATRNSGIVAWSAPGDNGMSGQAYSYDLRYSTGPINEANFGTRPTYGTWFAPSPAGTTECMEVSGLQTCSRYYWALKTRDAAGNWSAISNVPTSLTSCKPVGATIICDGGARALPGGPGEGSSEIPETLEFSNRSGNPTTGPVAIDFGVPADLAGQPFEIAVFDIVGRKLATLAGGEATPGRRSVTWDLNSERGTRVRAGAYFLRLSIGPVTRVNRMTLVR